MDVLRAVNLAPRGASILQVLRDRCGKWGMSMCTNAPQEEDSKVSADVDAVLNGRAAPWVEASASGDFSLTMEALDALCDGTFTCSAKSYVGHSMAYFNLCRSIYRLSLISAAWNLGAEGVTEAMVDAQAREATSLWGVCKVWNRSEAALRWISQGMVGELKDYVSHRDTEGWTAIRMKDEHLTREVWEGRMRMGLEGWEQWGEWGRRLALSGRSGAAMSMSEELEEWSKEQPVSH